MTNQKGLELSIKYILDEISKIDRSLEALWIKVNEMDDNADDIPLGGSK